MNSNSSNRKSHPNKKTAGLSAQIATIAESEEPQNTLPPAEWVGEMAIRILDKHADLKSCSGTLPQTAVLANEIAHNAAVCEALNIYRKAQEELARRKLVMPPVPAGLTERELSSKRVTFERGCKLITGKTRRDRAEAKYMIWREWEIGMTGDCDGMPEVEAGFSLVQLAKANAAYRKYFKTAFDRHRCRIWPKGRHKSAISRQAPSRSQTPKR